MTFKNIDVTQQNAWWRLMYGLHCLIFPGQVKVNHLQNKPDTCPPPDMFTSELQMETLDKYFFLRVNRTKLAICKSSENSSQYP
jgi:hypothetical protein